MVKQGYKQTEVGVIPEDWDVRKIGDFTDATAGGTPSTSHPEYWNGEILWMSSGELNKRRIHNVIGRITELGYNNSSTHMIPENCVLIGLAGQGKTRGTVAVNYVELCTNQSIAAIFPSKEHNSEYLYQNLWSRYEELRELSSGDGGRGGLNLTIIKNFPCAFPKLQEQNRIAEALSDVDELISSLEKLIEKYKSIKATCLQQMFPQKGETTPKMRLPGFTGAWEQRKLGAVVDVFSGRDYKHLSEGDIPVYGRGGYMLSVSEALSYDKDAIGIGRKGTIDKPYILNAPFWTVDTLFYAIPREKVDLNFAFDIFQNIDWKKKDESTGVPSLSKTTINEIDILVPQYDEQQALGQFFNGIDNLITLHQRKLEKLQNIKKSMLEKMFV